MNVRTLCLAILNFHEATGYEIRKLSTEGHFAYFVDASYGSIYPALNKLEQEGLVTFREETQSGKPARKIYSITEIGRKELLFSLMEPPQKDIFRSEFLLIGMCAEHLDPAIIEKAITTRKKQLQEEIVHLKSIKAESDHEGVHWIVDYGVTCLSSSLTYMEQHADRLVSFTKKPQKSTKTNNAAQFAHNEE